MFSLDLWKKKVKELKTDVFSIYLAYTDPRVPWYAKILAVCVVGYAFSPIDLIPDFIPILGYLDDLVIVPLGIILVLKFIPSDVLEEYRDKARGIMKQGKPKNWMGAFAVICIWIVLAVLLITIYIKK